MNQHHESTGPADEQQITLRGPAELADALPYLMGFHPNDSVIMVALHGGRGRFGGRLRLGIPQAPQEWAPVAEQLAECLIKGSERRGERPDAIVIFLCQDPAEGESGSQIMERLRPFAQRLRTACGAWTYRCSKRSASLTAGTGPTAARTGAAARRRGTGWPCPALR